MYGLINKAVQDVVVSKAGAEGWRKVCEKNGLTQPMFVGFEQYPDAQTYGLVGAASDVLGMPANTLLEEIGVYWSKFTVEQGYGHLMDMAGDSVYQVLQELNNIHARLMVTLPELRPPSFECLRREDGVILVKYYSERPGLSPLVIGLIRGLGERFGQTAVVTQTAQRKDQEDCDEFEVTLRDNI